MSAEEGQGGQTCQLKKDKGTDMSAEEGQGEHTCQLKKDRGADKDRGDRHVS